MKIKVEVKQNHIFTGIRKNPFNCPIYLAMKDSNIKVYSVLSNFCRLIEDREDITTEQKVDLPRSARRFIKRFDKKKEVKPFNFILEV